MSPWRRVLTSALVLAAAATVMSSDASQANSYEENQRAASLSPDPLVRSPRKLGLGRLEYVIDDHNHRLTMWDFAGNPTGISAADSGSTFELRPRTGSNSTVHDVRSSGRRVERQTLAARDVGLGFEAWRRATGQTAYGFVGEFSNLRLDRVWAFDSEVRRTVQLPAVQGIVSGPMPYVFKEHMRYALRAHYSVETLRDEWRTVVENAAGQYIDGSGDLLAPPQAFSPDEITVTRLGGGAAVSYDLGRALSAAVGYDLVGEDSRGENIGDRHTTLQDEQRPVHLGQVSAIGRLGPGLEYAVDAHGWRSSGEASWVFTTSAGVGGDPLAGRGKLLERDEEGSTLRARARWSQGPFEIGGGLGTAYRQVEITAPDPLDATSFNRFLTTVYYRQNADSIMLPDSVRSTVTEDRRWEAGGGLAWKRLPWRAVAGAEFHAWRDLHQTSEGQRGPKATGWEVRSGIELPLGEVVRVRGGYIYRSSDEDDDTRANEYVTHAVTLGLGLRPPGASWSVETGLVADWVQADFGDPGQPRTGRQILATQLRWAF